MSDAQTRYPFGAPPDLLTLGRRAVACPRWRWMPGMLTQHGERIVRAVAHDDGRWCTLWAVGLSGDEDELVRVRSDDGGPRVPDLSDPATLGCLLALVREAWNDPNAYACNLDGYDGYAWVVVALGDETKFPYGVGHHHGETEAEAHVVALEEAGKT